MTLDKQLTAAVNILAEYAEKHLAAGYTIQLTFTKDEVDQNLEDPDGETIDVYPNDESMFRSACETSVEDLAERNNLA